MKFFQIVFIYFFNLYLFRWAILSTLHWLLEHKHLHPDGYPNLYSEDEVN